MRNDYFGAISPQYFRSDVTWGPAFLKDQLFLTNPSGQSKVSDNIILA